jgi:hypothetical protein
MDRYHEAHPTDVNSSKRFKLSFYSNPATLTPISQFYQQCRANFNYNFCTPLENIKNAHRDYLLSTVYLLKIWHNRAWPGRKLILLFNLVFGSTHHQHTRTHHPPDQTIVQKTKYHPESSFTRLKLCSNNKKIYTTISILNNQQIPKPPLFL